MEVAMEHTVNNTSYKYKAPDMSMRFWTAVCWVAFIGFIIAAIMGYSA